MIKLPDLSSYSQEELQVFPLPHGQCYLNLLGQDPLYDQRHRAWLEAALATVTQKASAKEVCWAWSQAADNVILKMFSEIFDPSENLAVFAMGKLGAQELNLSSDVDLLFVSEEGNQEIVRKVREFQARLSQMTALGFLFRCDLDLRPGGKASPLVPSLDQVMDYYGNYGETWERIAFVRCRFVAGNGDIRQKLEDFLKKFIYRKHLDFSLFEDLKGLREKIQKAVKIQSDQIHLKLVPGGIRDIELFINALQVIHGGKNSLLQTTNTDRAFVNIREERILPSPEVEFFRNLYWRLRSLENYVQAQGDQQIHSIYKAGPHPAFVEEQLKNLEESLDRSSKIVSGLLGTVEQKTQPVSKDLQQILEIPLLSRNKDRDQKTRQIFIQQFSEALLRSSGNRDLAVSLMKEFVIAVRAKSGLFSLLVREPRLAEDLAWLFGHSPYLARILCQRPELLDSFVYRSQEVESKEEDVLLEQLLEKRLLGEIIQGTDFLKTKNIQTLMKSQTALADEVTSELLRNLQAEDLKILCLGKWGGQELGFRSDLDFIFVIEQEPEEKHFRTARRLISRLTEPHKGGSLYTIDMRLKPSGKGGPMIVQKNNLIEYLRQQSQAWERQVYLRSRGLNWDAHEIREATYHRPISPDDVKEWNQIRQQLIRPSETDLKYAEGGLLDIELFAQSYLLLHHLKAETSTLEMLQNIPGASSLATNYGDLRKIEQLLHLVSGDAGSDLGKKSDSNQSLAALLKKPEEAFLKDLKKMFFDNIQCLYELDPRRRSG